MALLAEYREKIGARALPVEQLAKAETLGQNPEAYAAWVAGGGKPAAQPPGLLPLACGGLEGGLR